LAERRLVDSTGALKLSIRISAKGYPQATSEIAAERMGDARNPTLSTYSNAFGVSILTKGWR